jgi:hypothetical protein
MALGFSTADIVRFKHRADSISNKARAALARADQAVETVITTSEVSAASFLFGLAQGKFGGIAPRIRRRRARVVLQRHRPAGGSSDPDASRRGTHVGHVGSGSARRRDRRRVARRPGAGPDGRRRTSLTRHGRGCPATRGRPMRTAQAPKLVRGHPEGDETAAARSRC